MRSSSRTVVCATLALFTALVTTTSAPAAHAASQDAVPLLLVLDASGSMLTADAEGTRRITAAKAAVMTVVSELPDGIPLGLRVFGTSGASRAGKGACRDSRLLLPVRSLDRAEVARTVEGVRARGWTPIGFALEQAADDLRATDKGVGTAVLVSDGIDECYPRFGPDPCKVARSLTGEDIRLTVHTVGLAVDDDARKQLRCIAEATGGRYADAGDADSLANALRVGLLPVREPPPAPPEPQRPDLVGPVLAVLALGAAIAAAGAGVRWARARRRRSYW